MNRNVYEEAYEGLAWREAEVYKQKEAAQKCFEETMYKGSMEFGLEWLTTNMLIAGLRELAYLPSNDARINALLVECAYVFLKDKRKHEAAAKE